MNICDSKIRLRANDTTYPVAGNRDLTDKKVIIHREQWGDITEYGIELVDTDHKFALPARIMVGGAEKALRVYCSGVADPGYWQGGNFGYVHQWNYETEKPLLYTYPFDSAGIDLDFPVVGEMCESRVGNWWLGAGGWFEIETPQWTDPSWYWVRGLGFYTDRTKCNGSVYLYQLEEHGSIYVRIWRLVDGVWGYTTHSGWEGLSAEASFEGGGMWEWDGNVYYVSAWENMIGYYDSCYFCNGSLIKGWYSWYGFSGKIMVSNNFTYIRTCHQEGCCVLIFSKTDRVGVFWDERISYPVLIPPDTCFVLGWHRYWPGSRFKYVYINGSTASDAYELPEPPGPHDAFDYYCFWKGQSGKAIFGAYGLYRGYWRHYYGNVQSFDPGAGTWVDHGIPWQLD